MDGGRRNGNSTAIDGLMAGTAMDDATALYPQFLYEIPFYVRGKKQANNIRNETMKRQSPTVEVAVSRH